MAGRERTVGGFAGKIAGKLKTAAGAVAGNDTLQREGRLQDAQADAEIEAREQRAEARQREAEAELVEDKAATQAEAEALRNEVEARRREEQIERERNEAERRAAVDAAQEKRAAEER